jgi:hypothetical protein
MVGGCLKCFNGEKNWQLSWYNDRKVSIERTANIQLAEFVDYKTAASSEPVLVQVNSKYYLQYIGAKSFNSGTGLHPDKVTVTLKLDNGNSIHVAGLGVRESHQDGDTVINVCSAESGNADIMVLPMEQKCPSKK